MKNQSAHNQNQKPNRRPVIIASLVLLFIVVAGIRKWSHKDVERGTVSGMTASADDEITVPKPRSLTPDYKSDQTPKLEGRGTMAADSRDARKTAKHGLTDAERATLPLDQFLRAEGIEVERIQENPQAIERRLQIRADSLSDGQRQDLRERVLSQDTPINEKQVAVHLLTLNIPASVPILKSIALAPVNGVPTAESMPPDLPLRLSALSGLESASLRDPQYRKTLLEVAERAPNKTVREVAQLSAQQSAKGRSFFEDYTKVLAGEKK